jgi:hypothetical protein
MGKRKTVKGTHLASQASVQGVLLVVARPGELHPRVLLVAMLQRLDDSNALCRFKWE